MNGVYLEQLRAQNASPLGLRYNEATGFHEAQDSRYVIYQSDLGYIESLSRSATSDAGESYTSLFRIGLMYLGASKWSVGSKVEPIDLKKTLLMREGQEFSVQQMGVPIGRAGLILTPARHVLEEICETAGMRIETVFRNIAVPSSITLKLLTHRFINLAVSGNTEPLMMDELAIAAISESVAPAAKRGLRYNRRMVNKAKEVLHSNSKNLSLSEVSSHVGVSPTHLTRIFKYAEGVPLYRYHKELRLMRALVELPRCDDITTLALALGFSDHSHFTMAFRSTFGVTPSHFRQSTAATAASEVCASAQHFMKLRRNG